MGRSVAESWELIDEWLLRSVPHIRAMLAPPATPAELREVERVCGVELPADLADWWRGANGMGPGTMSYALIVPPGLYLQSTHQAITHLHETREIAIDAAKARRFHYETVDEQADAQAYDAAVARMMRAPAGTVDPDLEQVLVHLPAWIMVARESRCYFVDCREGPLHGCVMQQGAHGGESGPLWPSVAAMWAETSDVLTGLDPASVPERVRTTVGDWWFPGDWWI
ncbi:hypothetical protein OHA21_17090 [Actinoplanes sp. NBC_00393]|uniref:hypothetical protein n=1 Tax=Actinoplanes sp. NBC_00393 TaxID=2975953 RepID=UPI002E22A90E